MKLLGVCILSWLAGFLAYLGALAVLYRQSISSRDLMVVVVWSGAGFAFACTVILIPVLMGLQRLLGGVRPAWPFPLISSVLGVAPTVWFFCWRGNLNFFTSPEISLFHAMFSMAGLLLGLGYVGVHRNPETGPS